MAAPTRPAPMPQPGWKPWASAEVVVEAMLPVAARAATATAAILVLIDINKYSVRLSGGPLWPASAVWTEARPNRFGVRTRNFAKLDLSVQKQPVAGER